MKRPLFFIGIVFSLTLLVTTIFRTDILVITSVAMIASEVVFLFIKDKKYKIIKLIFLTITMAFVSTSIYNIYVHDTFLQLAGHTVKIEGTITNLYERYNTVFIECKVNLLGVKGTPKNATMLIRSYRSEEGNIGESFSATVCIDIPKNYKLLHHNFSKGTELTGSLINSMKFSDKTFFPILSYAAKSKIYIQENLSNRTNKNLYQLAIALVTGDRDKMDKILEGYLARSGIMHMVAVSGMHMVIVSKMFFVIFLKLKLNNTVASFCTIPIIWIFGVICGLSASVIRSCIMLTITILGELVLKRSETLTSLGFAGIFTLMLNPYMVYNIGFQMSYLAIVGIATLTPLLKSMLVKISHIKAINTIVNPLCNSISAWLFVIPISALGFGYFSLFSPLTNLILAPIVPIALTTGLLSGIIPSIPILNIIGIALGKICNIMLSIIVLVSKFISNMPFAIITLDSTWKYAWTISACILVTIAIFKKTDKIIWALTILSTLLIFLIGTLTSNILSFNSTQLLVSEEITILKHNGYAIILELNKPIYMSYYIEDPLNYVDNIVLLMADNEEIFATSAIKEISDRYPIDKIIAPNNSYVQNYLQSVNYDEHITVAPISYKLFNGIEVELLNCGCKKIIINKKILLIKSLNCDIETEHQNYNIVIDEENNVLFQNDCTNMTYLKKEYWNIINFYQ